MRKLLYILVMLAGVLYACGDKNSFEIKGTIDGAANKKMVVQRTDNGVWGKSVDLGGRRIIKKNSWACLFQD